MHAEFVCDEFIETHVIQYIIQFNSFIRVGSGPPGNLLHPEKAEVSANDDTSCRRAERSVASRENGSGSSRRGSAESSVASRANGGGGRRVSATAQRNQSDASLPR